MRGRGLGTCLLVAVAMATALLGAGQAEANTYTVTENTDLDPFGGSCHPSPDATSECTIRTALLQASQNPGADTVVIPAALGPYHLNSAFGQLIASSGSGSGDSMTLQGTGAANAVIDADQHSRVLLGTDVSLTLDQVTLTDGKTGGTEIEGGGLQFQSFFTGENLEIIDARVTGNQITGDSTSDGEGGGVYASECSGCTVNILRSQIDGNTAGNGTLASGLGGGMFVESSDNPHLTVTDSSITQNTATGEDGADGFLTSLAGSGGGILVSDDSANTTTGLVTLSNSHVDGNTAAASTSATHDGGESHGGGVYLLSQSAPPQMTVTGGTISGNVAGGGPGARGGEGGGINSFFNGSPDSGINLDGVTMNGNSAGGGAGTGTGQGGAISSFSDVTINNSTLDQNKAGFGPDPNVQGLGGAVNVTHLGTYASPALTAHDSEMSDNETGPNPGGSSGGAMNLSGGGALTVTGSTLDANTAPSQGGAIYRFAEGTPTDLIQNTEIAGNSSGVYGGAVMLLTNGTMQITGSTISDSSPATLVPAFGGGIFAGSATGPSLGTLNLTNSTVTGNTSSSTGGGIDANGFGAPISLGLNFTTVADNSSPDGANVHLTGNAVHPTFTIAASILAHPLGGGTNCDIPTPATTLVDTGANVTDGPSGTCGITTINGDLFGADPLLAPLAANGGTTKTRALTFGSPAIDRVPPGLCTATTTDQRGLPRPPIAATNCDSGAYERSDSGPILATIGSQSVETGHTLSFAVSATDAEGDPLTYSASNLPAGASFTPATRTFSWTPSTADLGSHPNVHFSVTDGTLSASEDVTLTVTAPPSPGVTPPTGLTLPKKCKKGKKLKRGKCVKKKKKKK